MEKNITEIRGQTRNVENNRKLRFQNKNKKSATKKAFKHAFY